ncbi:MAG TPA: phosphodiesterase [Gammaproteobacteria bacterium]
MCVVQITDTHISRLPGPQFDGVDTSLTLRTVLDAILARVRAPDLVLLTGDLVDEPSIEAYGRLRTLLGAVSVPIFCLPGNHDEPRMLREQMHAAHISTPGVVDVDRWRIVLLDDWIPDSSGGRLAAVELERLRSALEEAEDRPVLLAVHHAPLSIGSPWMDAMGMENSGQLFDVIDGFTNVRALICGHIHQEFLADRNGVALLGAPSTCVQFMPGATEYEVEAMAPGYRELLLLADGQFTARVVRVPVPARGRAPGNRKGVESGPASTGIRRPASPQVGSGRDAPEGEEA